MHPVEEYQDITLSVDGLNECDLWRSQEEEWTSNYYITRCTGSSISWSKDAIEKTSDWRIVKEPGGFGIWRTSEDHPNDSNIENGQNTEKSPGDLRRLVVTQAPVKKISANADVKAPVKKHQLTLMWKTLKE